MACYTVRFLRDDDDRLWAIPFSKSSKFSLFALRKGSSASNSQILHGDLSVNHYNLLTIPLIFPLFVCLFVCLFVSVSCVSNNITFCNNMIIL